MNYVLNNVWVVLRNQVVSALCWSIWFTDFISVKLGFKISFLCLDNAEFSFGNDIVYFLLTQIFSFWKISKFNLLSLRPLKGFWKHWLYCCFNSSTILWCLMWKAALSLVLKSWCASNFMRITMINKRSYHEFTILVLGSFFFFTVKQSSDCDFWGEYLVHFLSTVNCKILILNAKIMQFSHF